MSVLRSITLFAIQALTFASFVHGAAPVIAARPGIKPEAFRITTFATNLFFPYGMARLPDNSLLVGTSRPRTDSDGYFASRGELLRLTDANGDGVADAPPQRLVVQSLPHGEDQPGTNIALPGILVDVRVVDRLVVVVSAEFGNEQILFLQLGAGPDFPLTLLGHLRLAFPWVHHQTYGLLVRPSPSPAGPGRYDVVFNVGALYNRQLHMIRIPISGLATLEAHDASLYRMTVTLDASTSSISVSELRQIAQGVRNAAGLAFDPGSGELWFADNGIDPAPEVIKSADELNFLRLSEAAAVPPHFGYPDEFVELDSGITNGLSSVQPVMVFREVEGDGESEGPAQMTWAPPQFPAGLNLGVFIGFHGDYDQWGAENRENAVVYADPATGQFLHFLRPNQPDVGHLDGLLATEDSLFLADLTGTNSLNTYHAGGVIYQIKHIGTPVDCGSLPPARLEAAIEPNGSSLRLSWDARLADCIVESSSLGPVVRWTRLTGTPLSDGERHWVTVPFGTQPRFFRLRCPECVPGP